MTFRVFSTALVVAASCLAPTNILVTSSEICPTMYADFNRRQLADFSVDGAYLLEEGSNAKHIPFLTISNDGTTGTVVVGNGNDNGVWHPMVASNEPGEVHFITHILVKDQVSSWCHCPLCLRL